MHGLEHRGGAAVGINRAIHPRIAMVARNHPLFRQLAPRYATDHVPERAELVVLFEVHLQLRRTWSNVIGERQRALPLAWRGWSAQMLQHGPHIVIRQR